MIRPFKVSEVATGQLLSIIAQVDALPSTGPKVYLVIRVLWLRFKAAVKPAPQTFPELEGALCVGERVFLLLQFGVIVGKLIEQNGNRHAVEDDAKRYAAKRNTAAKVGDRDNIAIAHSGDAHLQKKEKE